MNNRFRRPIILAVALCAAVAILPACTTTDPTTGAKVFDPVKTDQVKSVLKPVIATSVSAVLKNSPQHAPEIGSYFRSVAGVFCQMEANKSFSPAYLIKEVDAHTSRLLPQDPLIVGVKNSLVALYEINYGNSLKADIPPEQFLGQLASLFCAAINQGLIDAGQPGVAEVPPRSRWQARWMRT